jgi:hypothetical protein
VAGIAAVETLPQEEKLDRLGMVSPEFRDSFLPAFIHIFWGGGTNNISWREYLNLNIISVVH